MSADWERLVALFDEASALAPGERERFLARQRNESAEIAAELVRLLAADSGTGPLDTGADRLLDGLEPGAPPATASGVLLRTETAALATGDSTGEPLPLPPRIGRYEVVERIGRGGFGEVLRGFDPVLKRQVAIKTCPSPDPEVRRRFVHEAELAARLLHPNVTTVHDFGVDDGLPYLVQELLPGEDLADWLARQRAGESPAPLATRVAMLLDVARGLAHAHAAGVVHRDVKSGNLRVLPDGRVKILDFGIARELRAATGVPVREQPIGTLAYMAPEQARGEEADARADVWAFGAVAYELLSFRRALSGSEPRELLDRLLQGAPAPLRSVAPEVPAPLAALVDRCLEVDRERRFADGKELVVALEAVAAAPGTGGDKPRPYTGTGGPARVGRPRIAGVVAAALAIAAVAAIALWVAGGGVRKPVRSAEPKSGSTAADRFGAQRAPSGSGRGQDAGAAGDAPTGAVASPPPELLAQPITAGLLAIDARPWAEVVRVVDGDGHELTLPAERSTPLAFAVAPGDYRVTLRHGGARTTCRVHVAAGGTTPCVASLQRLRAADLLAREGP
ncbi:MAG TPA: serine/threonine-protein kinase [Thermoanaerobaculia bacterium]|jgi:serine/threonine-protein kinase|nr:serine/threonine-protein kinase [Thermoanaerobaculia bacterium]